MKLSLHVKPLLLCVLLLFILPVVKGQKHNVIINALTALFLLLPVGTSAQIAFTSSMETPELGPERAVDGNLKTRWSSKHTDKEWLMLDMQSIQGIVGLQLYWESAYGKAYDILISNDTIAWEKVYSTENSDGILDDIYFGKKNCRFIKINCKQRGTSWGYSLWEVNIKGYEEEIIITGSVSPKEITGKLFDNNLATFVHVSEGDEAHLDFSFSKAMLIGAIEIKWGDEYAKSYVIEVSDDRNLWEPVYTEKNGTGGAKILPIATSRIKKFRILLKQSSSGKGYSISEVGLKSWKELSLKNNLYNKRTIVGAENHKWVTFVGSDGTFATEPMPHQVNFWVVDKKNKNVITPEILPINWKLKEDRLPVSISEWERDSIKFNTTIFADKLTGLNYLVTFDRITIKNLARVTKELSLQLIIRQNPLCNKWNTSLNEIVYDGEHAIRINGKVALAIKEKPEQDSEVNSLMQGILNLKAANPRTKVIVDNDSVLGTFLSFKCDLKANEEKTFDFYASSGEPDEMDSKSITQLDFNSQLKKTEKFWKSRVSIEIEVPDKRYTDCFYSSIFYMLIMMKDSLLYPGPYAYKSFFLHDAIEMAGAFDKVGLHGLARGVTNHYNTKEFGNYGDELGGSIFGYYEHYRLTKDTNYLRGVYPKMLSGCKLIRNLRQQQMTAEFKGTPFWGLLPKSVSQDNFKIPAYLYVDNWWAINALKATAYAAEIFNDTSASWILAEYKDILQCTLGSIEKVMRREKTEYMSGFADLWPQEMRIVDADHRILGETQMAWANRPALFPGQSLDVKIPTDMFYKSYQNYWNKAGSFSEYDGGWFVEYEGYFWGYNVQLAIPMVYLKNNDVALKNIEWSLNNQNCPGGWCEAMNSTVNKNGYREITDGIIGDVPHGWTAAYYVHLLRNMIFYENYDNMVLLSCIPETWIKEGKKISVKNAPTYFGVLNFEVKTDTLKRQVTATIDIATPPKNGYTLYLPLNFEIKRVIVDGEKLENFDARCVKLKQGSKMIIIDY